MRVFFKGLYIFFRFRDSEICLKTTTIRLTGNISCDKHPRLINLPGKRKLT